MMNRRGFLGWMGATIAALVLATHLKFGELAPVPQVPFCLGE